MTKLMNPVRQVLGFNPFRIQRCHDDDCLAVHRATDCTEVSVKNEGLLCFRQAVTSVLFVRITRIGAEMISVFLKAFDPAGDESQQDSLT